MKTIAMVIRFEVWFLLLCLIVIIGHRLVAGTISTRGMLSEKRPARNYSPMRLQMLLFTLMTVLFQVLQILKDPTQFPVIPWEALLVLGGGNLLYLGSKGFSSRLPSRG